MRKQTPLPTSGRFFSYHLGSRPKGRGLGFAIAPRGPLEAAPINISMFRKHRMVSVARINGFNLRLSTYSTCLPWRSSFVLIPTGLSQLSHIYLHNRPPNLHKFYIFVQYPCKRRMKDGSVWVRWCFLKFILSVVCQTFKQLRGCAVDRIMFLTRDLPPCR